MKQIIYFLCSIGSILGLFQIIIAIILFFLKKQKKSVFLLLIVLSFAISGLILIISVYVFPEHMLPNSKQYIDWSTPRSGPTIGLFQDFDDIKEDLVDKLYTDPAAFPFHRATRPASISTQLIQQEDSSSGKYALKITFDSQGYGANITFRCKGSVPANAENASYLVFKAKYIPIGASYNSVGLKIRIFDNDGEIWAITHREGIIKDDFETQDIEIPKSDKLKDYRLDLKFYRDERTQWKFDYDGNAKGGDLTPSFEKISRITFDFLPRGIEGVLILDDIRFE